jgi:xanthine/uracil/vitamin C permease (AzgA family)
MASPAAARGAGRLARRFAPSARGTTLRRKALGGAATLLTMSHIVFVNPAILSAAGLPFEGVTVATALAAAVFTLAMGVLTNLPFALAPGLGLNAVVAFDVILGRRVPWPVGMACVVIEGLLAFALVLAGLREAVMRAVPAAMKLAIGVGIGLFITLVGLREGGVVVDDPATGIGLGDPDERPGAHRAGRHPRRLRAQRPRGARSDPGRHRGGHDARARLRRATARTASSTCRARTASRPSATRSGRQRWRTR